MKNKFFRVLFPAAILGLSIMLTAYAANSSNASETTTASESTVDSEASEAADTTDGEWYSDRDMEQSPDTSDAQTIEVTDGQTLSITEEGTYILQGTASDCTVLVNAPEAKVQLILDNVTVTNTSSPVIYVLDADKCFVTTAEGSENALTVSGTFTEDTENDVKTDAVIFAKSDLTLNGTGTLTISSTDNGITSKDELTVTGGTYNITASGKGLESNDSTAICDGTFTIDAKEGMESTYVRIDGGTFEISASDDGINAAANSDKNNVQVEINGGTLSIKMGAGDTDGIDSNGDLTINGGNISIECNSPFDYDGTGALNGGTVAVNGEEVTELTNQFGGGMGKEGMIPDGHGPGNQHPGDTDANSGSTDETDAESGSTDESTGKTDVGASNPGAGNQVFGRKEPGNRQKSDQDSGSTDADSESTPTVGESAGGQGI
ncbi:carbohydrate-binding domain-containing protein [Porcincola intestinalis]|uniref:Carbohydrate-binding domain-containing protein n=1 Tax=Porcincola intestinalis TaxID=2606632 RepID=A0A6L5X781_9FIRM|nr:carbohydrate-binding domain-containing protein [Porcincola intestinalis]MDY5579106.1 carbohydrate-binding domain-containing protein [Porcincola intestinalis]MSS14242.1 carbohydrate-binding domain-containing protein [Porcincola intestinalis]